MDLRPSGQGAIKNIEDIGCIQIQRSARIIPSLNEVINEGW